MRRLIPFTVFILFSLIPLTWLSYTGGHEFIGNGDYLSPVNVRQEITGLFSLYNRRLYGGYDMAVELGLLVPYWLIMVSADFLGFTPVAGTVLYVSVSLLIAQISLFLWLKHLIPGKDYDIILTLSAALFAYSPYLSLYIFPGQMGNYSLYAILPLLFLLTDRLLNGRFRGKIIIFLFLTLAFATNGGSFGIGPLYVIIWAISGYCLIFALTAGRPLTGIIKKYVFLLATIFLSNLYWILPWFFVGMAQTGKFSQNSITQAVRISSAYSSIAGLLTGQGAGDGYNNHWEFLTLPQAGVFSVIFLGVVSGLAIRGKSGRFLLSVGMLIFALFINAGSNPPFGKIFLFLYDHFPGFTIFRRPLNKFSAVYLTFYLSAALLGFRILENRYPALKKAIRITLSSLMLFAVITLPLPVATNHLLPAFTPPDYYREAWKVISSDQPTRVLVFPGHSGVHPAFGAELNYFQGFDFLYKLWDTSIVKPDFSDYSPAYPAKDKVNSLVLAIMESRDSCGLFRETGVSHVVIRTDTAGDSQGEPPVKIYSDKIKASLFYTEKKVFGSQSQLEVFPVAAECRLPRISVMGNSGNQSAKIIRDAGAKIIFSAGGAHPDGTLIYLENYSPWWKLVSGDMSNNSWWEDILLLFHPDILFQTHGKAFDWANSWTLPSDYPQALTLYYLPQAAISLGIGLWIFIGGIYLVISLKRH